METFHGKSSPGTQEKLGLALDHHGDQTRVYDSGFVKRGCAGPMSSKQKGRPSSSPAISMPSCPRCKEYSDKLKKEIISLLSRVQAVKVIKMLLGESREEIAYLKDNVRKRDLCVEHLQSRLHQNGLSTSVKLNNGELFMPGHDKNVLNDLIRKNKMLLETIKQNYNSVEISEATKTIEKLEKHISELTQSLSLKEMEFHEHLQLIQSSDSVKDSEIGKLKQDVQYYYKQRDYTDDICMTLTGETNQMKLKIEVLGGEMKRMDKELNEYESREKLMKKKVIDENLYSNPLRSRSTDSGLGADDMRKMFAEQVSTMKREKTDMEKQLRDVISMNTRWQKYSDQREAYVVQLTKTNQLQASSVTVLQNECTEVCRDRDELKKVLFQREREMGESTDAAVVVLEGQLAESQEQLNNLQKEYSLLENKNKSTDETDHILMLEEQVKLTTEDFNLERHDRTALQSRYEDLTFRYNALEQSQKICKITKPTPLFNPYDVHNRCGYHAPQMLRGRMALSHNVEVDGAFDTHDGSQSGAGSAISKHDNTKFNVNKMANDLETDGTDSSLDVDEQPLQCPRCFRGFQVMEHAMLVEHIETCTGEDFENCD